MSARAAAPLTSCLQFHQTQRISRRGLLEAGALSLLGLGLADWQRLAAGNGIDKPQRSAKAGILLFMWGGPSQLDTLDPKPQAPAEIRGDFKPIATKVPGIQISEHFSRLAQHTDKLAIVRSLTHNDPAHLSSGHATLTGHLAPVVKSDDIGPSRKDSPHLGSLITKLRPADRTLPSFVSMPWKAFHPAAPGGEAPGQNGGWLGADCDGMLVTGDPSQATWKPGGLTLPEGLTADRLQSRSTLLDMLDQQRRTLDSATRQGQWTSQQSRALDLLVSTKAREAFDLSREDDKTRDRYGRNIHGQCVLLARRLVEHGVPLVSVNWHNDGQTFWDTHGNNFNRLKNDLIPPADAALSALLEDLSDRGLLDDTLVAWVGEFGRRPQISQNNAGREHWPFCYSGLLAGGGIRGGMVYGASDRHAAYPVVDPVSPQDFATTMLHSLGIPTDGVLNDREGRPHKISSGRVVQELLGCEVSGRIF